MEPTVGGGASRAAASTLNKVPHVTLLVWLVAICSAAVGETGSDLLDRALGLAGTTVIAGALLAIGLVAQLAVRRHIPAIYWADVVIVSVVGALCSDDLVDGSGVPLWASTTIFGIGLAIAFTAWFLTERTLSVHTIVTRRREAFSWVATLLAVALGISAGDWFAVGIGLGALPSAIVFAGAIAVVAVARFGFEASAVVSFWVASVLIRPLGASLADVFAAAPKDGGLGLGTAVVSDALLVAIVAGIVVLTIRERRTTRSFAGA